MDSSKKYQAVATDAARQRNLLRADLDLLWWRNPHNPNRDV